MNEKAAKLVQKARINLILDNPFWGFLALHMDTYESDILPTMWTTGEAIGYNPDYILHLNEDPSLKFVQKGIKHELWHVAFGHLWRRGTRDPDRWNIAADAVVDEDLAASDGVLPPEWVRIDGVGGMSAEEVYRNIKVIYVPTGGAGGDGEAEEGGESEGESIGEGEGEGQGQGQEGKDEQDKEGKGSGSAKKFETEDGKDSSGDVTQDHSQWGKKQDGSKMTEAEQKNLAGEWKSRVSQARQLAKQQGKGLGHLETLIDELLEPKLSWIEFIHDFVISAAKTDYRIIPPSKRHLHMGMYLPSLYGEKFEVGFAVDTSGSMNDDDVKKGLSEVKGASELFGDFVIHLFQADYGVQDYRELTPLEFDFPGKIRGRGGTSFVPVFNEINEKGLEISSLIYFTDLMGDFPDTAPPYPVMWLASPGHGSIEVPFGVVKEYEPANGGKRRR